MALILADSRIFWQMFLGPPAFFVPTRANGKP